MKRTVAVVLLLALVLSGISCFSGCSSKEVNVNAIEKGEFFALFIDKMGLYPVDSTQEEMIDAEDYNIEAQTMVDWGLLSEELALNNLDEPATKEVVVYACINYVYFRSTGEVSVIKDAEKCADPQAAADAVATGLIELNNGYFDAKQKMTESDCNVIMNKALQIDYDGGFVEGEGYAGINPENENTFVMNSDSLPESSILAVEYDQTAQSEYESDFEVSPSDLDTENAVTISNLNYTGDVKSTDVDTQSAETITIYVTKTQYEFTLRNVKVNSVIFYDSSKYVTPLVNAKKNPVGNFVGRVISVDLDSKSFEPVYKIVIEKKTDEDIVKDEDVKAKKYKYSVNNISFSPLKGECEGFNYSISPNSSGTGIECSVSKTFTFTHGKVYGDWRDATISPTVSLSASMSDFSVEVDDIKSLVFGIGSSGYFRLKYKTGAEIGAKAEDLRYVPTNNGNGHFASNFRRSRITDGAGAKTIKIASIPIALGSTGFSIKIGVYLEVSMDGSISISLDKDNDYVMCRKNGNLLITETTVENKEIKINVSLDAGVKLEVSLNCALLRTSIIGGYVKLGVVATAAVSIYQEETRVVDCCFTSPDCLSAEMKADSSLHSCIDLSYYFYVSGGLTENNMVVKFLKIDTSKVSFKKPSETKHFHYEDVLNPVSKCTRGKGKTDETTEKTDDEKFAISTYKVVLDKGLCGMVYVVGMPISEKQLNKKYKGNIQVEIADPSVASVIYNKETKTLLIDSKKAGSTEVKIYVRKGKGKKQYTQTFSVTISDTNTLNSNVSLIKTGGEVLFI